MKAFILDRMTNFDKTTIMKLRFILIAAVLVLFPFCVKAQILNPTDTTAVKLYSEGKMYVGANATNANNPVMHVDGSMKFYSAGGAGGTTTGLTQVEQIGITELTGDFVDGIATKAATPDILFTSASNGVISFVGEEKKQYIYRDQKNTAVKAANGYNYVNFPALRVDQKKKATTTNYYDVDMTKLLQVSVQPHVIMSAKDIQVGNSGRIGAFSVTATHGGAADPKNIYIPRLYIEKINNGSPASTGGWMRYNLELNSGDFTNTSDATIFPVGGIKNKRHLTPFSSPFQEIALDYMFYSFVMSAGINSGTGIFGENLTDPRSKLKAGHGYFLAMEAGVDVDKLNASNTLAQELAAGYDFQEIYTNNMNISPFGRAQSGYQFSRQLLSDFHNKSNAIANPYNKLGYSKFTSSQVTTSSLKEYFTASSDAGIQVAVKPGLNFIGNPFLMPLDLSPVLVEGGTGGDSFTLSAGAKFSEIAAPNVIRAKFWVLKDCIIDFLGDVNWWGPAYKFQLNAYVAQNVGGTITTDNPTRYYAPPLSVFALQSTSDITLTFKPRTGKQSDLVASDTRANNGATPKASESIPAPVDEILFRAINKTTGVDDRISLVFRDKTMLDEQYDEIKVHKSLGLTEPNSDKGQSLDDIPFDYVEGGLFTKTPAGQPMMVNALPTDIKQLALYVVPPQTGEQVIELTPYRMNSLQSINRIWIEDKLTGDIKELQPEETFEYTIAATGEDPRVSLKNRFVLYFNELPDDSGTGQTDDSPISVSYFTQTLHIAGLNDIDNGSKVEVYDLQGRLVTRDVISTTPTMTIYKPLSQGAYIVKIKGKRNFTGKFMSLQN